MEGFGGVSVREAWLGDFLVADRGADAVEELRLFWGWGGGLCPEVEDVLPHGDDRALRSFLGTSTHAHLSALP